MTAPPRHPSFLELDRAALGLRSPALEQHLQGCAECGAYLARVTRAEPIPAWVQAPRPDRRRAWPRWGWPVLATAALASVLLVVLPGTPPREGSGYVAPKSAPAVAVYIKRGDQVFLWDGQAPLVPEDRIRLQVASETHRYVTVAARSEGGAAEWTVLYEGALSTDAPETALPASWRVDAAGGEEVLRVLFSTEPLSEARAAELFPAAPRTETLWTTELRLPKSPPP
jgi:hypothetical protein